MDEATLIAKLVVALTGLRAEFRLATSGYCEELRVAVRADEALAAAEAYQASTRPLAEAARVNAKADVALALADAAIADAAPKVEHAADCPVAFCARGNAHIIANPKCTCGAGKAVK